MSDSEPGRRRVLPPVYLLISLVLMACLHVFLPGYRLLGSPLRYGGLLFVAAAIGLVVSAAGLFRRAGTTIKPFQEPSSLILRGPYRMTRNPIYVGLVGTLLGVGLMLGSATPFLVVAAFAMLLDRRFVRAEEAALERAFGTAYTDYKSRVRRWV